MWQRESKGEKLHHTCAGSEMSGLYVRTREKPLGAEGSCQLTPARKWGPQSYNLKEGTTQISLVADFPQSLPGRTNWLTP